MKLNREWQLLVIGLGFYLLMWPLLYRGDIDDRFVISAFALIFLGILWGWQQGGLDRRWQWLMLLPLLLNSSFEVKFAEMARAWPLRVDQFYESHAPDRTLGIAHYQKILVKDRRLRYPGASLSEAVVFADTAPEYFYESKRFFLDSYDHRYLLDLERQANPSACNIDLLRRYKVRYLYSYLVPFEDWPADLATVAGQAEPVTQDGRILHVSAALLSRLDCPIESEE